MFSSFIHSSMLSCMVEWYSYGCRIPHHICTPMFFPFDVYLTCFYILGYWLFMLHRTQWGRYLLVMLMHFFSGMPDYTVVLYLLLLGFSTILPTIAVPTCIPTYITVYFPYPQQYLFSLFFWLENQSRCEGEMQ